MSIVNAKQRMAKKLFHAHLKLIQVFISLLCSPLFTGIQSNLGQVRFSLGVILSFSTN